MREGKGRGSQETAAYPAQPALAFPPAFVPASRAVDKHPPDPPGPAQTRTFICL